MLGQWRCQFTIRRPFWPSKELQRRRFLHPKTGSILNCWSLVVVEYDYFSNDYHHSLHHLYHLYYPHADSYSHCHYDDDYNYYIIIIIHWKCCLPFIVFPFGLWIPTPCNNSFCFQTKDEKRVELEFITISIRAF